MTTEANGSTNSVPNLPATPEPSPVPRPRRPEADSRAPAPDVPGQPNLADHEQHRRWEWRTRRLLAQADHWMLTRVKHPDGGERTVTETRADEEEQRQQINRETDMGSRKHRRLPRWQGWIPKFVLAFDFALLLYFFAGITNVLAEPGVDEPGLRRHPGGMVVLAATASVYRPPDALVQELCAPCTR